MAKDSLMNRWCRRAWIYFGVCITFCMTAVILYFWNDWSTELIILAAVAALVPIHVVEEWVFPGGFHYQYNFCWRSDQLDRYPMCRKSDMYTNLIATFMYIGFTVYCAVAGYVPRGLVVGTIGFCLLEIFLHTLFGTVMYIHFRSAGKQTIYGPGSITAYFGFGVFGVILARGLNWSALTSTDWLIGALVTLGGIGCLCVLLPETIIKKRNNNYAFPTAGYYERFLNK